MTTAAAPPAWRRAPATHVCALVARAVLDASSTCEPGDDVEADEAGRTTRLGDVTLRPHQMDAVARLRRAMRDHGGALLADEVGLGKTYVALALAREARSTLVVAPAALRATWMRAVHRTRVRAPFVSAERLSRSDPPMPPGAPHDLVIVDEAHHFRNPGTRRYAALAALARHARVLLLSATPVHNRRAELDALLALFLGSRAATLGAADHARLVVRRGHDALSAVARPPRALPLRIVHVPVLEDVTERILAIPPPVPTADGGIAGSLVSHGLLRLWASSAGALRSGLRRRLVRAEALLAALDAGHHLSRAELERWVVGDDVVQLGFPELLGACDGDGEHVTDGAATRAALRAHAGGVRAALGSLAAESDGARADVLRRLRRRHAGERIVAFSQYAETVRSCFAALRGDRGVCALTAREALVAGGRMSRTEALRRFAPHAHGAPEPPEAERVTLLLSTDVASEGLDLTDASVVVHLDMPWTPARLAQRVGRLTRLGSPHAAITVYALAPPAPLRALLGVERALRAKWGAARRLVGGSGDAPLLTADGDAHSAIAPGSDADRHTAEWSAPDASEQLRALVAGWSDHGGSPEHPATPTVPPLVAAVEAHGDASPGYLAIVSDGAGLRLLAGAVAHAASPDATTPSDDPRHLLRVARTVNATSVDRSITVEPHAAEAGLAAVTLWIADRRARRAVGAVGASTRHLQRHVLARIAATVSDAPLHRRPHVVAAASAARLILAGPLPAAVERQLADLATSTDGDADEHWLRSVAALGDATFGDAERTMRDAREPAVIALLLVVPPCHESR